MKWSAFPPRIRTLEPYAGRFDAFRLTAQDCDVLFGTYPGGTRIERHTHPTDNWGVITKGEMVIAMDGAETRYAPGDWYHVTCGSRTLCVLRRGYGGSRILVSCPRPRISTGSRGFEALPLVLVDSASVAGAPLAGGGQAQFGPDMQNLLLPRESRMSSVSHADEIPRLLDVILPGFDRFLHRLYPGFRRPSTLLLPLNIRIPVLEGVAHVVRQPEYWADRLLGAVREAARPRLMDCFTGLRARGTWRQGQTVVRNGGGGQSSRLLLPN
jgi:hypothetical protein